jgi:hypothetical protein
MANFDPSGGGLAALGRVLSTGPALDVFASGPGGIAQTWYNSVSGWNDIPGAPGMPPVLIMSLLAAPGAGQEFIHPPSVVSWGPSRLDLFAVTSAGDLWHFWADDENQPQTTWESESLSHPGHGQVVSAPAAVVQQQDMITVFARAGRDGALFGCVWDPANGQRWSWSTTGELGWAPEPGPYIYSPAACSWDPSRIDLFAVTRTGEYDGQAYGTVQHSWQQDFPGAPHWHPDYWENAATPFAALSSPVAVSWLDPQGDQYINMVYCGPEDIELPSSVGITRWVLDGWATGYLYQASNGDGIRSFPTITSWAPGRLDVFWFRNDYLLQHGWNITSGDPDGWGWEQFSPQYPGQPPS